MSIAQPATVPDVTGDDGRARWSEVETVYRAYCESPTAETFSTFQEELLNWCDDFLRAAFGTNPYRVRQRLREAVLQSSRYGQLQGCTSEYEQYLAMLPAD